MEETNNTQLIFLAEDDADNCDLFAEALQSVHKDHRLVVCRDGIELLQQLNTHPLLPDIIFLDLNMPRKNGWESLADIRKDNQLADIPVVIFSTASGSREVQRVYDAGADLFVVKPDCYNKLKSIIRDILFMDIKTARAERAVVSPG